VPRHSVKRLVFMTPPVSAIKLSAALLLIAAAIPMKLHTRCVRENSLGNGCPMSELVHLGFYASRAAD